MCKGCTLVSVNDISEKCVCVFRVCASVLFTLTDLLMECCLAVTGRRPSLALSHRWPCTLSLCCQGHAANQSEITTPRPPKNQHTHTQNCPLLSFVTAASAQKNLKTAVSQPSAWTLLSLWGMVTGEGSSEFEHMTRIYLRVTADI